MNSIRAGMLILTLILGQHIIQPGEWLYSIGRAYGVDPGAIATASGIALNSTLHPGQVLVIPDAPKQLPPGPTAARQFGTDQVIVPVDNPLPRITPWPVITPAPIAEVIPPAPVLQTRSAAQQRSLGQVTIRYSWYWPPLLGPNCAIVRAGQCVSHCANGDPWPWWVGKGIACPNVPGWEFGTQIRAFGPVWTCVDRGGMVVLGADGIPWLDFLVPSPHMAYGATTTVQIIP